jgi:hypothetical protein
VWGSHRPLHEIANAKSSVANDKTGLEVLNLKDLLQSSTVSRQPIAKRETKFKGQKDIETLGSYRVRTPRSRNRLDWMK